MCSSDLGESASLGERLLEQALKALGSSLAEIDDANWERVNRETVGRTKQELLADIGLGKQLPAVVARRLLKRAEATQEVKGKAARWSSAAPRAWRCSSPPAAARSRATPSSAR